MTMCAPSQCLYHLVAGSSQSSCQPRSCSAAVCVWSSYAWLNVAQASMGVQWPHFSPSGRARTCPPTTSRQVMLAEWTHDEGEDMQAYTHSPVHTHTHAHIQCAHVHRCVHVSLICIVLRPCAFFFLALQVCVNDVTEPMLQASNILTTAQQAMQICAIQSECWWLCQKV